MAITPESGPTYKVPTVQPPKKPGRTAVDYTKLATLRGMPIPLTQGQKADAARYTGLAVKAAGGLTRGQVADAARYTGLAISQDKFPNLMSPQIASALGLSEADRTALGYDPNWPYTRKDPLKPQKPPTIPGAGGGGGGAESRPGGGRPAVDYFGGGSIGLINWRV
jgi:hypothetical protein